VSLKNLRAGILREEDIAILPRGRPAYRFQTAPNVQLSNDPEKAISMDVGETFEISKHGRQKHYDRRQGRAF
jgi:hypothetical protein